jgi:hypothetical protein
MLGDLTADLGDLSCDFVTHRQRVGHNAPVSADGVDVGVADACVPDLDENVARPQVAPLHGGAHERFGG